MDVNKKYIQCMHNENSAGDFVSALLICTIKNNEVTTWFGTIYNTMNNIEIFQYTYYYLFNILKCYKLTSCLMSVVATAHMKFLIQ